MEIGLVEWFNDRRGFGLLKMSDNKEVFLHISNWKDSIQISSANDLPIIFKVGVGVQRKKITALDCNYFNSKDEQHWNTLFSTKEPSFLVKANYREINLLLLVLDSLDADFNYSIINKYFKDRLNSILDKELFNPSELIFRVYNSCNNQNIKFFLEKIISHRVNKLNNSEIIKFWKETSLKSYLPSETILIKTYKEIGVRELEKIDKKEIKNLIIIKKLISLSDKFNVEEFLLFDQFLDLIDKESLKTKVYADLIKLANSSYIDFLKQKVESYTQGNDIYFYDLRDYLNKQPKFLDDNFIQSLKEILKEKIIKNCSFRFITECWKENLIDNIDNYVIEQFENQSKEDLLYFLSSEKITLDYAQIIFDYLIKSNEFELVLDESKKFSSELFEKFDKYIFESLEEEEYFGYWRCKKGRITPLAYLSEHFNHKEELYSEIENWIKSDVISSNQAKDILLSIIKSNNKINNRYDFYTLYYAVRYIVKLDINTNTLTQLQDPNVSLILWHFKKVEEFDFETLKGKFIYFKPEDQVYIFKRLFYLKHKGQIKFDLERLDEILRDDVDLHLTNEKFDNDFVLDISTHIIIECLKSYVESGNFVFESDLILKDLIKNSNRKFEIKDYFDKCEGRLTPNWNLNTSERRIKKVKTESNGKTYEFFKVEFKYNEDIVNDIRKISRKKYHPEKKYWGVFLNCELELLEFAKKHRFFIELPDDKHYSNNTHLAEFTRNVIKNKRIISEKNIPSGIVYCEGRKANKKDYIFKKEFWWCCGQECLGNSCTIHVKQEFEANVSTKNKDIWERYTLLDFLYILNINVDENNGLDHIKDGDYFKFLGHINAFNRLLERLYCEECNNLLYPKKTSHFALYTVNRFYCIEETCSKKDKEVYLSQCLYGECKTIIDSRVSKRCGNGLFICHNCGTCCSTESFVRRLKNLVKVGGYINPQLVYNIKHKKGHLEKKEYYCYKCSGMMTEISNKIYQCSECNVKYGLEKFKWLHKKWESIDKKRTDYPIYRYNDSNDEDGNRPF